MTRKPYSVRIFLQDGDARGVRIVSRSKWSGRCMVIPRACLAEELSRAELGAPGVYLLTGSAMPTGRPALCVGAADPVCHGLEPFILDDLWSTAIIFTCKESSLNLAQYQLIATFLRQLATAADKAEVVNAGCGEQPSLLGPERCAAKNFLDHMLGLYPLFGVTAFES